MAVTRSKTIERAAARRSRESRAAWRRKEFAWSLAAGLLIGAGLYMVYKAKAQPFPDIDRGLAAKTLLNLNDLSQREQLLPSLSAFPTPVSTLIWRAMPWAT